MTGTFRGNWVVSLKKGVSDRGGLSVARAVLEISWSVVTFEVASYVGSGGSALEVALYGESGGSTLIITALGLAILVIGPSGLVNPGTQVVLFMEGVETAIVVFPTWEMGKRRL